MERTVTGKMGITAKPALQQLGHSAVVLQII